MLSASKSPLGKVSGTSPVNLNLPRSLVPLNGEGKAILVGMIKSALSLGIAVMPVPIWDVDLLEEAMEYADGHEDIIVRVRGFSARWVDVGRREQEHIIARAIAGG